MSISNEQLQRKLMQENFRLSSGTERCANCAHQEKVDGYSWYRCRLMEYFFAKGQRESCVCNKHMSGSQQDGLINELAILLMETQNSTAKHRAEAEKRKRNLLAEREQYISELSQQTGLFAGMKQRKLQRKIAEIEEELRKL